MIETHIISNHQEMRKILPECNKFAKQIHAEIPFNYIESSLIWWNNFNNCDDSLFSQKRGTNFLGNQSKLKNLFLLIAKNGSSVCGAIPFASFEVKIPHEKTNLNVLCFAGDYGLFPFQDFLIDPSGRTEILSSMLSAIIRLLEKDYNLLFLGYLPESSPNIHVLRKYFSTIKGGNIECLERKTGQRGGVRPWTFHAILSILKKIQRNYNESELIREKLNSFIERLEKMSGFSLLLSGTRLEIDRKSTRLNSSHVKRTRMPSSA